MPIRGRTLVEEESYVEWKHAVGLDKITDDIVI